MLQSLVDAFVHRLVERPHAAFLKPSAGGRFLTYSEVGAAAQGVAAVLGSRGVRSGDRVAIMLENRPEWVSSFLGALSSNTIVVPLNTRLTDHEIRRCLADCDPAVIIAEAGGPKRVFEDWQDRVVASSAFPEGDSDRLASPVAPDDPAMITYTSGTTGLPKGVTISNRSLLLSSVSYAALFNSEPTFTTAIAVPLFHNTGFVDGLGHAIVAGGSVELHRRFNPLTIAGGLATGRYSFFIGVPTMYSRILETMADCEDGSHPRAAPWLAYGGALMTPVVADRLQGRFPEARLVNCYGMSEATSITHYLPAHLSAGRWDAVGVPVPGTADRIADSGELEIDSPTAMLGYWGRTAESEAKLRGAWLRTGDFATKDQNGIVRISGRLDDLINRGGEKIAPFEIESAILGLVGVSEAAVVGMSDPDLGEVPGALVVVSDNSVDPPSILSALADSLADFKMPRHVFVVGKLPKNASGKVSRSHVREIIDRLRP